MVDLVGNLGLDWAAVRDRMARPQNPLQGVLAALLSSPVDAEKLSYLFDDSAATGVPFGKGIQGSPIFESITVPHKVDWDGDGGSISLGVRERAMSYLEHTVLARYWNIQTAYWNRTNRAVQAMIKFQIKELILSGELDFGNYVEETLHLTSDAALRWLNQRFVDAQARKRIEPSTVNPIEPLLVSERAIYKRLVTISGNSRIKGRKPDHKIFERVQGLSPLDDDQVLATIRQALQDVVPGLTIRRGELLLDLPRQRREEAGGSVLVYTDDGTTLMGDLFEISPFLENHKESFELNVKRMRVFLHPRLDAEIRKAGASSKAYEACLAALRKEWGA
jgi:hypothetical protein